MAEARRIVRRRDDDEGNGEAPSRRPSRRPNRQAATDDDDVAIIHGGWTEGQKVMDATSPFAQAFKPDENGQIIKFLDDTPYANFRRHWVDRASTQPGGGQIRRAYVCRKTIEQACPLCDLGDRAQAVAAFNVVVLGDDGQLLHKSWDVGARIFQSLKAYNKDPRIGPLSRHYFIVTKTGKNQNAQTNCSPIKTAALEEDWDTAPADPDQLEAVEKYTPKILDIPSEKTLTEIATEIADDYA